MSQCFNHLGQQTKKGNATHPKDLGEEVAENLVDQPSPPHLLIMGKENKFKKFLNQPIILETRRVQWYSSQSSVSLLPLKRDPLRHKRACQVEFGDLTSGARDGVEGAGGEAGHVGDTSGVVTGLGDQGNGVVNGGVGTFTTSSSPPQTCLEQGAVASIGRDLEVGSTWGFFTTIDFASWVLSSSC